MKVCSFLNKCGKSQGDYQGAQRRKARKGLGQELVINKDAEKRLLLIRYIDRQNICGRKRTQKYGINRDDFDLAKSMFNYSAQNRINKI